MSDSDMATTVMAGCRDDMKALWQDKAVQQALKRRKLILPDSAGLLVPSSFVTRTSLTLSFDSFLNDLDRIASRDYVVTDNDIVRARLRTVGIQEHRLTFKTGPWDHTKCDYLFLGRKTARIVADHLILQRGKLLDGSGESSTWVGAVPWYVSRFSAALLPDR